MNGLINVAELIGLLAAVAYAVSRLPGTTPTGTGLDVLGVRRR